MWSPKEDLKPEWINAIFPNANNDNYIVYTNNPMRQFLIEKEDTII